MNHIVSEMNTCYNIPYHIMACMRRDMNENYHKNVTAKKLLSLEISLSTVHRDCLCYLVPIIILSKRFKNLGKISNSTFHKTILETLLYLLLIHIVLLLFTYKSSHVLYFKNKINTKVILS